MTLGSQKITRKNTAVIFFFSFLEASKEKETALQVGADASPRSWERQWLILKGIEFLFECLLPNTHFKMKLSLPKLNLKPRNTIKL